ncbi:hypothetical protein VTO42DRAFT_6550 [Malbranchea cinnamomea]
MRHGMLDGRRSGVNEYLFRVNFGIFATHRLSFGISGARGRKHRGLAMTDSTALNGRNSKDRCKTWRILWHLTNAFLFSC